MPTPQRVVTTISDERSTYLLRDALLGMLGRIWKGICGQQLINTVNGSMGMVDLSECCIARRFMCESFACLVRP
jgi:hypothetical protein